MDENLVRKAAEKAAQLASSIKVGGFRNPAFGVLFSRLLDTVNDKPMPTAHSKGTLRARASGRNGKGNLGPKDRLRDLVSDGFFKNGRSLKTTLNELNDRGYGYEAAIVGKGLQRLCQERVLRRKKGKEGNRDLYLYTNW